MLFAVEKFCGSILSKRKCVTKNYESLKWKIFTIFSKREAYSEPCLKEFNYFSKMLHLRCLTGFGMYLSKI